MGSNPEKWSLEGQVAVITGGGGGVGRGIALSLAEAGAAVVVGDIVLERCDEVADTVAATGGRALGVPTDVMDTNQVRALVTSAHEHFGRVDILVNNAGGVSSRPFLEQSERSWRRHIDINLVSMLAATSAAAPLMIAGGRAGSIINVASMESFRAAPNYAVYAACKAGMVSFTKSMALELSQDGIRVNAIAPDHTISPGNRGQRTGPVDPSTWTARPATVTDALNRVIPMLREGEPEECGDAVVFLASRMASYVTGTVLPVDGGTWAGSGWVRDTRGNWTQNEGMTFDT